MEGVSAGAVVKLQDEATDLAFARTINFAGAGVFVAVSGGIATVTIAGGGTPGGSNTQVQYNNSGSFGGITGATTDGTTLTLVAPVLGTPTSGTLTNCTGLPEAGITLADNTSAFIIIIPNT